MNEGKRFEENWKKSISKEMYFQRIKDNPSNFGNNSNNAVRFTLNNPYDCFIFYMGYLFPLELKSTKGTSFSIQKDKKDRSKMIKHHQIEGLLSASKYEGIYAGFVLDFRNEKSNNTYWLDIKDFYIFQNNNDKKSINEKDVISYGGILIKKNKKKVNYKYDIIDILNEVIERGKKNI